VGFLYVSLDPPHACDPPPLHSEATESAKAVLRDVVGKLRRLTAAETVPSAVGELGPSADEDMPCVGGASQSPQGSNCQGEDLPHPLVEGASTGPQACAEKAGRPQLVLKRSISRVLERGVSHVLEDALWQAPWVATPAPVEPRGEWGDQGDDDVFDGRSGMRTGSLDERM
jgi:hypothetical protein